MFILGAAPCRRGIGYANPMSKLALAISPAKVLPIAHDKPWFHARGGNHAYLAWWGIRPGRADNLQGNSQQAAEAYSCSGALPISPSRLARYQASDDISATLRFRLSGSTLSRVSAGVWW